MRSQQLQAEKLLAIKNYNTYQAQQNSFVAPVAEIAIDKNNEGLEVYMYTEFNNINLHFESIKLRHTEKIHDALNSQGVVCTKFGSGDTKTLDETQKIVARLSNRFALDANGLPVDQNLYLYSGFVVSDEDTGDFLGMVNLCGSNLVNNHAQISRLNRADAWSHKTEDLVNNYDLKNMQKLNKNYSGLGTVETCTLLQYGQTLKNNGYKLNNNELAAVDATARVDNPGSWKSSAKAGLKVTGINANPSYGPELRYQLSYQLK